MCFNKERSQLFRFKNNLHIKTDIKNSLIIRFAYEYQTTLVNF